MAYSSRVFAFANAEPCPEAALLAHVVESAAFALAAAPLGGVFAVVQQPEQLAVLGEQLFSFAYVAYCDDAAIHSDLGVGLAVCAAHVFDVLHAHLAVLAVDLGSAEPAPARGLPAIH